MAMEIHPVLTKMQKTFNIRMPKLQRQFKSPKRHIVHRILKQFSPTLYMRRASHIKSAGCASKWIRYLGFKLTWSIVLLMRRASALRPSHSISQLGQPQAHFKNILATWVVSTGSSTWSSAHCSASYQMRGQLQTTFWRSRREKLVPTSLFLNSNTLP